jgi:subtilisin family serine protease
MRRTTLDQSVPQVNAPAAWAAGYTGSGVTVAVIDSGIDTTHADLAGKVTASANFTTEPDARDYLGHGTHVASTIAGSGSLSGGALKGVAPDATLLNSKVCIGDNTCQESAIIAGMQWAAQQGAKVANVSLGGPDSPGIDPMEQAVADLTGTYGTLFVIAAGNSGRDLTVSSPGSADAALTVGAVDGANNLAPFSSRGPRVGDTALKPDITGPGVNIDAARSSTGVLGTPGQPYMSISGTSMATPHVAGAAAILTQRQPSWSPALRKAALMGSAAPSLSITGAFSQGAGLVNVGRAVNQQVTADPPSLSLGRQAWPHDDDPVLTRTITYTNRNPGNGVGLTFNITAYDPNGAPAPPGMFTVSPTSISLAPGASAAVTFTVDTRIAAPDGYFGGQLFATGAAGGISIVVPFAVDRAIEGYELTLRPTNRAGSTTDPAWSFSMGRVDGTEFYAIGGVVGQITLFVTKGTYLGLARFDEGPNTSVLVMPKLVMDHAQTLDLDARLAQPVDVTVPDADALHVITEVGAQLEGTITRAVTSVIRSGTMYTKQLGPATPVPGFVSKVTVTKAKPGPTGTTTNSPRVYPMAWYTPQQFPTGLVRNVSAGSLAIVNATHNQHVVGANGWKLHWSQPIGTFFDGGIQEAIPFSLPFTRSERHNSDGTARFFAEFTEESGGTNLITLFSSPTQFFGGVTVNQTWNRAVFGPALASTTAPSTWVVRGDNTIVAYPPLLGDGSGFSGHPLPGTVTGGQVVLKRNGVEVGSAPYPTTFAFPAFAVPAASATYRLEADVERGAPATLSTKVSAAWTFTSAFIDATTWHRLPLWSIAFAPALNASNAAPKNSSFTIPITLAGQPGSPVSGLQTVTVQYSTDDGVTWQNATVTGSGTNRTVTLTHPNLTGFVSLKATANDFAGNAVEQTVIRAYRIA